MMPLDLDQGLHFASFVNLPLIIINTEENEVMKQLPFEKAVRVRRLLRMNILLAFVVFAFSVYLILTGEYNTLQERNSTELIYNVMAIGSLVYMAVVWISCMMSKPFWFPSKAENR